MVSAKNDDSSTERDNDLASSPKTHLSQPLDLFSMGILNSLTAHICVLDIEGTIIAINRSWQQFGLDNGGDSQLLNEGANYFTACLGAVDRDGMQDAEKVLDGIKEVLKGHSELFEMEYDCHSPEEERWFLMRVTPMEFQGPKAVVTHIDITEKKRAEREQLKLENHLHKVQKIESIGHLAGGVAHDFNNMLGVILGHTELALMKADPDNPFVKDLKEIRTAAKRSADLTRQLLIFARKDMIAPKVLNVNEAVAGTLSMLQRLIGENIHLSWSPGASLWSIRIDPSQLDQILANLCVNARDAIDGMGTITITTQNCSLEAGIQKADFEIPPGDYVLLSVSDDGHGIDPDHLGQIFEPFFTSKEFGQGTGMGLATVYGAVKQNHGFIDVVSEPGQGASFHIYLPRQQAEIECAEEAPAHALDRREATILVVEDDQMLLDMTKTMLQEAGYTVLAAQTSDRAIILAKEHPHPIHLLLSDIVMPTMNGKDLRDRLKGIRPEMKVIFMSGYTDDIITQQGVVVEGTHFLQKPITYEELTSKIQDVLDQG